MFTCDYMTDAERAIVNRYALGTQACAAVHESIRKAQSLTFAPGDVVRLKSGGPRMTIEKKWPNQESYEARWWNYTDRSYGSAYFKPETLVRAKGLDNE